MLAIALAFPLALHVYSHPRPGFLVSPCMSTLTLALAFRRPACLLSLLCPRPHLLSLTIIVPAP
jgi:hypothetical protein